MLPNAEQHCVCSSHSDELLNELEAARAKIQYYAVMCRVRGPMGDVWGNLPTHQKSDMDVYLEWSRSAEHSVVAIRDRRTGLCRVRGISGDVWFWGDSAAKRSKFQYKPDREHTFMRMFDPLVIGLGFRNEFENGTSFEASLKGLRDTLELPGLISNIQVKEKLAKWSYNTDTEIVFDTEHAYWPVSLKYNSGEITWDIELGQEAGFDLPMQATLVSKHRQEEKRTVIDFEWLSINEPFKPGKSTIERLSQKFAIELKQ